MLDLLINEKRLPYLQRVSTSIPRSRPLKNSSRDPQNLNEKSQSGTILVYRTILDLQHSYFLPKTVSNLSDPKRYTTKNQSQNRIQIQRKDISSQKQRDSSSTNGIYQIVNRQSNHNKSLRKHRQETAPNIDTNFETKRANKTGFNNLDCLNQNASFSTFGFQSINESLIACKAQSSNTALRKSFSTSKLITNTKKGQPLSVVPKSDSQLKTPEKPEENKFSFSIKLSNEKVSGIFSAGLEAIDISNTKATPTITPAHKKRIKFVFHAQCPSIKYKLAIQQNKSVSPARQKQGLTAIQDTLLSETNTKFFSTNSIEDNSLKKSNKAIKSGVIRNLLKKNVVAFEKDIQVSYEDVEFLQQRSEPTPRTFNKSTQPLINRFESNVINELMHSTIEGWEHEDDLEFGA